MTSLCIVIVNWNSGDQLEACVRTVADARVPDDVRIRAVVVDNDSADDSVRFLERGGPNGLPTKLIKSRRNLGFGRACNRGFRTVVDDSGVPDFVLFLNPDTEVFEDTFERLFTEADLQEPRYGIFGVQMVNEAGIATTCSNFPSVLNYTAKLSGMDRLLPGWRPFHHHMTYFDHDHNRTVDQVMGAFFMVRGSLFQELGGFDERFFVYFEEVDFAFRSYSAGHLTRFLARPRLFHRGGGTTGRVKGFRQFLSVTSRHQFFRKHYGVVGLLTVGTVGFVVELPLRVFRALAVGDLRGAGEMVRAYWKVLSGVRPRR